MTDIAARPVILITMQNLLIAKDIEQTIQEAWPNAEVITAAGIAAAEVAIATRPQIDIAFLEPPTTAAFPTRLVDRVIKSGGKMVILGSEKAAPDSAEHWQMLGFPFTTDDLLGFLSRFQTRTPAR